MWSVDESGEGANDETLNWMSDASVDFSNHIFTSHADFREFIFPHTANFDSIQFNSGSRVDFSSATVRFRGVVNFRNVTFHGKALFRDSTFESIVRFNPTRFQNTAGFRRVTFSDHAWFSGARFDRDAVFSETTFSKTANFSNAVFVGLASFDWAESTDPFSLSEARFLLVPDFSQMSFRAPARLDNLEILEANSFQIVGNKNRAARYRALKKLATESHDHVRELDFFASETKERRGNDDHFGSGRYILGFIYELFSDFGRSILRPLAGLFGAWLVMAAVYGTSVSAAIRQDCGWTTTWMAPEHYLSLLHTLPFVGLVRAGRRELALKCLYGSETGFGAGTDVIFIAHNTFAAILIFLFFLAVRNHFKIK